MSDQLILGLLTGIGVILSGAGVKQLIAYYITRERERSKVATETSKDERAAGAEQRRMVAIDNEHARTILQRTVEEQDDELREIRTRELAREREIADVKAQLARLEERSAAQAAQIAVLQNDAAKWNRNYEEMRQERDAMKTERDEFKLAKQDADSKLTSVTLKASLLEREVQVKDAEIDRLRGQLAAAHLECSPMPQETHPIPPQKT